MAFVQKVLGREGCLGCLIGLISLPLFVVVGLGFVVPAVTFTNARRSRRLRRAMTLAGRVMSWDELPKAIKASGGTLIHDWAYWGWSGDHVWWTPDNIQARADAPPWASLDIANQSGSEMNKVARLSRWIAAQYFGPTAGAFLIHASGSRLGSRLVMSKVAELRARYSNLTFVHISSKLDDHFVEDDEFEVSGP